MDAQGDEDGIRWEDAASYPCPKCGRTGLRPGMYPINPQNAAPHSWECAFCGEYSVLSEIADAAQFDE